MSFFIYFHHWIFFYCLTSHWNFTSVARFANQTRFFSLQSSTFSSALFLFMLLFFLIRINFILVALRQRGKPEIRINSVSIYCQFFLLKVSNEHNRRKKKQNKTIKHFYCVDCVEFSSIANTPNTQINRKKISLKITKTNNKNDRHVSSIRS